MSERDSGTPIQKESHSFHDVTVAEHQWVDPDERSLPPTIFATYLQESRASVDTRPVGSYRIYLPDAYALDPEARFPVLFWLHGGFGDSAQGVAVVERIHRAISLAQMPAMIVVLPQALPIGWYVDSKDGARPIEQTIVKDLLPHIDGRYRTIPSPDSRFVEGFSMGGYGALRLAFKYPHLFGRVSALAPAILRNMADEPPERIENTFFGDAEYFEAVAPWTLLIANSPEIRSRVTARLVVGADDLRLVDAVQQLTGEALQLGVRVSHRLLPRINHDFIAMVDRLGPDYFAFWSMPND